MLDAAPHVSLTTAVPVERNYYPLTLGTQEEEEQRSSVTCPVCALSLVPTADFVNLHRLCATPWMWVSREEDRGPAGLPVPGSQGATAEDCSGPHSNYHKARAHRTRIRAALGHRYPLEALGTQAGEAILGTHPRLSDFGHRQSG